MSTRREVEDITLGYLEKTDDWKLYSKYFPSKIGGRPAWLVLDDLPEVLCNLCKKPLIFLGQVYAPISEKEDCFHRTLFIFVCLEGSCNSLNSASNVKIFRSQLPRANKYYSFEPSLEKEEDANKPSASDYTKLCFVCGSRGSKICGSCHQVNYCSREHQTLNWRTHKVLCKQPDGMKSAKPNVGKPLFDEYEVDCEPEELELQEEKAECEIMKEYEEILRKGQRGADPELQEESAEEEAKSDLIKMAAKETDKTFTKFRTRIADYPDQVLRYNLGGEPLYVSSDIPSNIPNCEECGGERCFEFQIMPQLLVHLKLDCTGPSLDWGTLLVYTCKESCTGKSAYLPEVVCKQDYTPDVDFLKQS